MFVGTQKLISAALSWWSTASTEPASFQQLADKLPAQTPAHILNLSQSAFSEGSSSWMFRTDREYVSRSPQIPVKERPPNLQPLKIGAQSETGMPKKNLPAQDPATSLAATPFASHLEWFGKTLSILYQLGYHTAFTFDKKNLSPPASWAIFTGINVVMVWSGHLSHAPGTTLLYPILLVGSGLMLLRSSHRYYANQLSPFSLSSTEKLCLAGAVTGLLGMATLSSPALGQLCGAFVECCGTVPLFKRTLRKGHERIALWGVLLCAAASSALQNWLTVHSLAEFFATMPAHLALVTTTASVIAATVYRRFRNYHANGADSATLDSPKP